MFATILEIRERSRYKEEFKDMSEGLVQGYIDRADIWIIAKTHCDYTSNDEPIVLKKLKIATIKLVDYLYFFDNKASMEDRFKGVQSESTEDYSYTLKSEVGRPEDGTGDPELDLILESLTLNIKGYGYFGISGPTRSKRRGVNGIR